MYNFYPQLLGVSYRNEIITKNEFNRQSLIICCVAAQFSRTGAYTHCITFFSLELGFKLPVFSRCNLLVPKFYCQRSKTTLSNCFDQVKLFVGRDFK